MSLKGLRYALSCCVVNGRRCGQDVGFALSCPEPPAAFNEARDYFYFFETGRPGRPGRGSKVPSEVDLWPDLES